ncbi:hypothetical protein PEC301296_13180 [Pectobacterium carotovorum subsp. carotovorum]|nr:hypothetical protein PB72LOC_00232 [Pectobacterium atrosepticum]GKV85006.1 hypothetical protein PEC301296_13180 [Pectobacterium carotovorum subsp. carotovorum]
MASEGTDYLYTGQFNVRKTVSAGLKCISMPKFWHHHPMVFVHTDSIPLKSAR